MQLFFDDFVLDTDRRELRRRTNPIALEPQVFDLLEYIIRNHDRVVSRDDLLEAVWKGRVVSESTLSSRINAARVAIGDSGEAQRLIKTLPRKGIRFVAKVRAEGGYSLPVWPSASSAPATIAGPNLPTIAVLPFDSMSGDPEDGYFADGMTEEIITALSRCSGMTVIARNSSFIFRGCAVDIREVGRQLGAGYVLEGSVRRNKRTLRITAQLIDASTSAHLWADRFDGHMSDVFELQDRIAECTVGIIEPRMRYAELERARRKPPENLSAYELRLRAMALSGELTETAMKEAITTLARALEIEPTNALSMATAAYYRAQCQFQGWMLASRSLAEDALRLAWQAVALDDQDANVQWLAAFAIWTFARDAERARQLFRRSLEINPNNALAHTLSGWVEVAVGNADGGRRLVERSLVLNPRHPRGWFMSAGMAVSFLAQGMFEDALPWAEKATVQNRQSAVAWRALAVSLAGLGESAGAKKAGRELLRIEPTITLTALQSRLPWINKAMLEIYIEGLRAAGIPE
ncbi:MAG: winged helix-turn-helix domain-containing protein [Hyphomicrobiaceae bacterium]